MGRIATFEDRAAGALRSYGPAVLARWQVPEKRFLILTTGRAGSELLVELLDSHPEVVCDGELLAFRPRLPRQFVKAAEVRAHRQSPAAYGWKVLAAHLKDMRRAQPGRFLTGLCGQGYRLVLLERRDYLQQSLSWYRAQSGRFQVRAGDGDTFAATDVDPQLLLWATGVNQEVASWLRETVGDLPHLPLVYEDDLLDDDDRARTVPTVCDYIGVGRHQLASDLVKVTPRRTGDMVSNWDEVRAAFEGTRFAHLVDERAAPTSNRPA